MAQGCAVLGAGVPQERYRRPPPPPPPPDLARRLRRRPPADLCRRGGETDRSGAAVASAATRAGGDDGRGREGAREQAAAAVEQSCQRLDLHPQRAGPAKATADADLGLARPRFQVSSGASAAPRQRLFLPVPLRHGHRRLRPGRGVRPRALPRRRHGPARLLVLPRRRLLPPPPPLDVRVQHGVRRPYPAGVLRGRGGGQRRGSSFCRAPAVDYDIDIANRDGCGGWLAAGEPESAARARQGQVREGGRRRRVVPYQRMVDLEVYEQWGTSRSSCSPRSRTCSPPI